MLELTRRMTPARSSVSRLAGAYFDEEGYVDGTFNTHFLKLSQSERSKNLNLAKAVLISKTNEELKDYQIPLQKHEINYNQVLHLHGYYQESLAQHVKIYHQEKKSV